jgi:hypothetical protein
MNNNPETLYCGKRETVIAEVGGSTHIYPGKYLLQPDGNGNYDAEGVDSIKGMKSVIAEFRAQFPGIRVVML